MPELREYPGDENEQGKVAPVFRSKKASREDAADD
jgi:hypothetical protein